MEKLEIAPSTDERVRNWLNRNDMGHAPKPWAVLRLDSRARWQVWSWHVSQATAARSIARQVNNRPVR